MYLSCLIPSLLKHYSEKPELNSYSRIGNIEHIALCLGSNSPDQLLLERKSLRIISSFFTNKPQPYEADPSLLDSVYFDVCNGRSNRSLNQHEIS